MNSDQQTIGFLGVSLVLVSFVLMNLTWLKPVLFQTDYVANQPTSVLPLSPLGIAGTVVGMSTGLGAVGGVSLLSKIKSWFPGGLLP